MINGFGILSFSSFLSGSAVGVLVVDGVSSGFSVGSLVGSSVGLKSTTSSKVYHRLHQTDTT